MSSTGPGALSRTGVRPPRRSELDFVLFHSLWRKIRHTVLPYQTTDLRPQTADLRPHRYGRPRREIFHLVVTDATYSGIWTHDQFLPSNLGHRLNRCARRPRHFLFNTSYLCHIVLIQTKGIISIRSLTSHTYCISIQHNLTVTRSVLIQSWFPLTYFLVEEVYGTEEIPCQKLTMLKLWNYLQILRTKCFHVFARIRKFANFFIFYLITWQDNEPSGEVLIIILILLLILYYYYYYYYYY